MKVGLVLSGGGAKGAYQAGVVKALAEFGVEVDVVSGASIGSLNGGVISASRDIRVASEALLDIWKTIGNIKVLEPNFSKISRFATVLATMGVPGPSRLISLVVFAIGDYYDVLPDDPGFFKDKPLRDILDKHMGALELSKGLPLYVSLYPENREVVAFLDFLKGEVFGRFSNQKSEFKLIQDLPWGEQVEGLVASAAIPLAFKSVEVEGKLYTDGGQGDYRDRQGNTPITPLIGQGLDLIIVSHLEDGSLWDSDEFSGESVLELRPSGSISDNILDVFSFEESKIDHWINSGYMDTCNTLKKVGLIADAKRELEYYSDQITKASFENEIIGDSVRETMEKVRRRLN